MYMYSINFLTHAQFIRGGWSGEKTLVYILFQYLTDEKHSSDSGTMLAAQVKVCMLFVFMT